MEVRAYIKNVPSSPKKMRFTAANIRSMSPVKAIDVLLYTPKKSAQLLRQALLSAVSNAKSTFGTSEDLLQFKSLIIEEGIKIRRFRAGSKGMAKPYRRKFSHIKIVLTTSEKVASASSTSAVSDTSSEVKKANDEPEEKKEIEKSKVTKPAKASAAVKKPRVVKAKS